MISEKDKTQFQELGYFVTDVVIEPDQLQFMADEMDRLYREGVEEAKATGDPKVILKSVGWAKKIFWLTNGENSDLD